MAMFEQALKMWNPFGVPMPGVPAAKEGKRPEAAAPPTQFPVPVPQPAPAAASGDELNELKAQLVAMQQKLEKISRSRG